MIVANIDHTYIVIIDAGYCPCACQGWNESACKCEEDIASYSIIICICDKACCTGKSIKGSEYKVATYSYSYATWQEPELDSSYYTVHS